MLRARVGAGLRGRAGGDGVSSSSALHLPRPLLLCRSPSSLLIRTAASTRDNSSNNDWAASAAAAIRGSAPAPSASASSASASSASSAPRGGRGGGGGGRGRGRGGSSFGGRGGRRRSNNDDDDEDEDEDQPRTRRWSDMTLEEMRELQRRQLGGGEGAGSDDAKAAKTAAPPSSSSSFFEPWQERRLAMAHAEGRRRVAVGELANSLGVDRRAVLDWWQAFAARPESERKALLEAAAEERAQMSAEERAQAVPLMVKKGTGNKKGGGVKREQQDDADGDDEWANSSSKAATATTPSLPAPHVGAAASAALRRLPAEVTRTLEAVYARTPYPGAEVMQSLYALHRLPKAVAAAWFSLKRAEDGRPQNPRKAAAAGIAAAAASNASRRRADASGFVEDLSVGRDAEDAWWLVGGVGTDGVANGGVAQATTTTPTPSDAAATVLSTAAAEAAAVAAALASPQLRSSLPSPKKLKKVRKPRAEE